MEFLTAASSFLKNAGALLFLQRLQEKPLSFLYCLFLMKDSLPKTTEGLNTSLVFSLIALPLSSKLLAIQSFSQRAEMLSPALLPTEASKEVQRANSKRKSQALLGISSLDLV